MEDVVLAQLLRTGDLGAAATVHDRFARELYDYAGALLADPDEAAEALHEALLLAVAWAPGLADPTRLRSWLFALTRNQCLRRPVEPSARGATTGTRAGPAPDESGALREVFDLVHRHLLEESEVAAVLGVSPRRVRTMRTRSQIALAELGVAFVPYRAALRGDPPAGLRERVLASVLAPGVLARLAARSGPRRSSGFPVPPRSVVRLRRVRALGVAAIVGAPVLLLGALLGFPAGAPEPGALQLVGPAAFASPAVPGAFASPAVPGADASARASAAPSRPSPTRASTVGTSPPRLAPGVAGEVGMPPAPRPSPRRTPAARPSPPPPTPAPAGRAIVGLGKCLDVQRGGTAQGTPVDLAVCNGTRAQRWTFGADGTLRALGYCADLLAATRPVPGGHVVMRACDRSATQRWLPVAGLLVNARAGMCLDVPGPRGAGLTRLIVWRCDGRPNQRWRTSS